MSLYSAQFTVFFEDPFWVGLYERTQDGKYEACRIVFGKEPKDSEVLDFLEKNFCRLKFSPSLDVKIPVSSRINPKRMQRMVQKQQSAPVLSTKSQLALKALTEQNKTERKTRTREMRKAEKQRDFELRRIRLKEKHRGH